MDSLEGTTVNIFSVSYFDDIYHKLIVLYRINDSVDTLPNAVTIVTGKLLRAGWPWILGELPNAENNL